MPAVPRRTVNYPGWGFLGCQSLTHWRRRSGLIVRLLANTEWTSRSSVMEFFGNLSSLCIFRWSNNIRFKFLHDEVFQSKSIWQLKFCRQFQRRWRCEQLLSSSLMQRQLKCAASSEMKRTEFTLISIIPILTQMHHYVLVHLRLLCAINTFLSYENVPSSPQNSRRWEHEFTSAECRGLIFHGNDCVSFRYLD